MKASQTDSNRRVFRLLFRGYMGKIVTLGVFGVLSSLLAGIGISAIIPLFSLALGRSASTGRVGTAIEHGFAALHIPFTLKFVIIAMVSLFVVRALALFWFAYVRASIRFNFKHQLTEELFRLILGARWPFFLKQKFGYLQNVILRDAHQAAILLECISQIILSFSTVAVLLAFAFFISVPLTIYTMVAGACLLLLVRPIVRGVRSIGKQLAAEEREISQFVGEHVIGAKSIKSLMVERGVDRRARDQFTRWEGFEFTKYLYSQANGIIGEPLALIFISLMFLLYYRTPGFHVELFLATMLLIQRIFVYLESGQSAYHLMNEIIPHAVHIVDFREELREAQEPTGEDAKEFHFQKEITFENVSLTYQGTREALREIRFSLRRGEMLGLVGPSGSGKTSIADLLLRFFEPTSGRMLLDGASSRSISLTSWRKSMGYVSQDIFLLNATIRENIKFYSDDITDAEMREAAGSAEILDFIESLPHGFDTVVGDRGIMLSGGQRQRIVLARVLARKPEILILDEATSALDTESERAIQKAIEELHGKVTVLIIAHRLSTVMNADRLIVLGEGTIIEEGSPEHLLKDSRSYFHRIYQAQTA